MRGPNPFTELLFRFYTNQHDVLKTISWSEGKQAIAMAILKQATLKGSLPKPRNFIIQIDEVSSLTGASKGFVEIVKQTLLRYRSHEDRLRYYDFVLALADNDAKAFGKGDRRKSFSDFVTVGETLDRQLESAKDGYKIKLVDLFNDSLKLDDVKKRVQKFHRQLRASTYFVEQFYFDLPDGHSQVDEVHAYKSAFTILNNEMTAALSTNTKDQFLVDCFLFLTRLWFEKQFGKQEALIKLKKINILIGSKKGMSPENLDRIRRDALKRIEGDKRLESLYQSLL